MRDIAEHMGEGKQGIARKIWSAKKKLSDVGLTLPPRDAPYSRRAEPTDPQELDISTKIVAVA